MASDDNGAKVLIWDVETSPVLIEAWQTWEAHALEIKREQYLLSFAYKWLGEDETHVVALPDFRKAYAANPEDDTELVKALHAVLSEADITVAHNGDKFDKKKANARFLKAGLPPTRPSTSVDTLKVARKHFSLSSNRLDALGEYLGVGRKEETGGYSLWQAVMKGDKAAWRRMKRYNKQDVALLEQVYLKLRPWIDTHPNVAFVDDKFGFNDADIFYSCPACGSENVHREGARRTRTMLHRRVRCVDCGSWFTGVSKKVKPEELADDESNEVTEETSV